VIQGFPRRTTVVAGGQLELCASTDAPAFRVELYRWGAELTLAGRTGWLDGRHAPPHLPFHDWGRDNAGLAGEELAAWPVHGIAIGADWPPGVYVAVLVEGDGRREEGPAPDARHGRALFVVRSPAERSSVLYKLPLLTWHAYNQVSAEHYLPATGRGGWCLYSEFLPLPVDAPLTVSVLRPGGGTGGTPFDSFDPDPFDGGTPRQTFAHWDAHAVAWLERQGYAVDFCTDLDLHAGAAGDLLAPYRLLVSFGHDEYYSAGMRAAIERFVAAGGNVAFFGGNTCWWEVGFDGPFAFRRLRPWWKEPGRPENTLTGVSFRHGGHRPPAAARTPPVGFRVQHADHWAYAGTGLRDGDVFGRRHDEHLVGYECDGAHFDRLGRLPARPTGDDGTPPDFAILGVGDVGASGWGDGNRAATLGVHAPGGTVFTASTTDWPRVLAQGSPAVERITHNVLDRLR
jgi:hypothetical protein